MASLASEPTSPTLRIKMLHIGDTSGSDGNFKSKLLETCFKESFNSEFVTTIGIDYKVANLPLPPSSEGANQTCQLIAWDTAGQERFKSITTSFFRGADALALCYDVHNKESFERLRKWCTQIKKMQEAGETTVTCYALVGVTTGDKKEAVTAKDEAAFVAEFGDSLVGIFTTRVDHGDADAICAMYTSVCAKVAEAGGGKPIPGKESPEKEKSSGCAVM